VNIGNDSVPVQLAQCWFPGLAISKAKIYKYIFQIKYTEATLSNSTQKLLWFEIIKMLIAVLRNIFFCVIYNNFRHTFVPYARQTWWFHFAVDDEPYRRCMTKFTPQMSTAKTAAAATTVLTIMMAFR